MFLFRFIIVYFHFCYAILLSCCNFTY
uniref:Uncharacterized protein n=1 Tax=Anguilla anguilla TaxID=7936 RepID=A0A0E9QK30_ANGAN